ncbi:MFS transporter [Nonomuraea sp. NPDC004354]
MLAIGLFVRARVEETLVFATARQAPEPRSAPLLDVLRHHPRTLLLSIGVGLSPFVLQGTLTTFLVSYGVQAGFARQQVLNGLTLSSAIAVAGILGWLGLSDRVGRRPIVLAGALAAGSALVIFPLTDSGSVGLLTLALVLGTPSHWLQIRPRSLGMPGSRNSNCGRWSIEGASFRVGEKPCADILAAQLSDEQPLPG